MIDYMCMDHPWHNNHSPRLKIVPYQATIGFCISGPRLDYIARLNRIGAIETTTGSYYTLTTQDLFPMDMNFDIGPHANTVTEKQCETTNLCVNCYHCLQHVGVM